MKKRNRKNRERRRPVRAGPTPGVILIPADYGKDWLAALKGDTDDLALAAARNDIERLIQGEIGEVFRTKIVPSTTASVGEVWSLSAWTRIRTLTR